MPATSTDQVRWLSCNVTVGGEQKRFARDQLLPPPASPAEAAERAVLRLGGALAAVEVYYEPGEAGAPEASAEVKAAEPETAAPAPAAPAPAKAAAAPVIVGAEDDDTPSRPPSPPRPAVSKKP